MNPEPFWQDEARVFVAAAVVALIGGYVVAAARLAYYRWRLRQAEQESARIAAQEPVSAVTVYDQDCERLVSDIEAFLAHPSHKRPS